MRASMAWALTAILTTALLTGLQSPASAAPAAPDGDTVDQRPNLGERGVFATMCRFSHQAADDPIVFPGQPGKSHLHAFFGSTTTSASSTYESLRTSATTCRTEEDASGYWVPALYQNGVEVQPLRMKVYYRTGGHDPETVQPFPPAFRVVAGDATATSAQGIRMTFWRCRGLRGPDVDPGFGANVNPPACPEDAPLTLHIQFPECWDGASLDSPDHKSHVVYGRFGRCPASHPAVLPTLSLIVHYPIVGEPGTIALASGSGYSAHADFFNAWDQEFLVASVRDCLHAKVLCGVR